MASVLIVGASGVVGSAALERFLADDARDIVAISRREPQIEASRPYRHVSVDLSDARAVREALSAVSDVEDVVYAALYETPGLMQGWVERDHMQTNLQMLRNVIGPVLERSSGLRHVSLLQGTKAYGVHLHPLPIPARERAPRDPHENFYWLQEDLIRERAGELGFTWTILRPQLIVGSTLGAPMNLIPVIGVYGAICAVLGLPFSLPGGGEWVWQTSDARIVAGALLWASNAPAARNEIFNVTNGEVCAWGTLWPSIARTLGLEPAPERALQLSAFLPEHEAAWQRAVARHRLRELTLREVVGESHHYADFMFLYGASTTPPPTLVSDVKIRAAGFGEVMDTEATFHHWLTVLMQRQVLPPAYARIGENELAMRAP